MTTGDIIPATPQKVVRLAVTESDDAGHDAHLLREVIGVLLEYPGRDRVNLDIRTGEKRVRMDLPVVSTGYCDSLHTRLEEVLGPDTVTVHQELGLGMEPPEEVPVTMPLEPSPAAAATPAQETTAAAPGSSSSPEAPIQREVPVEMEPGDTAEATESAGLNQAAPVAVAEAPAGSATEEEARMSVPAGAESPGDEPPF